MKNFISLFIILVFAMSCKKAHKLEKDIAAINTDVTIERFDKLFGDATLKDLPDLRKAYPFMFSKKYTDSFWMGRIQDTIQQELVKEVKDKFLDTKNLELEIESLFNHLKYYFPEFNPSRIITTTSMVDYRNKIIVTDTISIVAIDNYLGKDHKFYQGIPKYIRKNFNKEQIVVDIAEAYSERYIYQTQRKTLLDEMIFFGKQLYFKYAMLPNVPEAERIGYTKTELDWARKNENYIWRYFVERELLYSTDSKLPSRFINPAPFSKFYLEDIDTDSPGRIGQYIGWQIVSAFMENNKVSLKDMLTMNAEEIFNTSKFKPRK